MTLADREEVGETPKDALAWMARSLGLTEPGERPSLDEVLSRFDANLLPKQPTVWKAR